MKKLFITIGIPIITVFSEKGLGQLPKPMQLQLIPPNLCPFITSYENLNGTALLIINDNQMPAYQGQLVVKVYDEKDILIACLVQKEPFKVDLSSGMLVLDLKNEFAISDFMPYYPTNIDLTIKRTGKVPPGKYTVYVYLIKDIKDSEPNCSTDLNQRPDTYLAIKSFYFTTIHPPQLLNPPLGAWIMDQMKATTPFNFTKIQPDCPEIEVNYQIEIYEKQPWQGIDDKNWNNFSFPPVCYWEAFPGQPNLLSFDCSFIPGQEYVWTVKSTTLINGKSTPIGGPDGYAEARTFMVIDDVPKSQYPIRILYPPDQTVLQETQTRAIHFQWTNPAPVADFFLEYNIPFYASDSLGNIRERIWQDNVLEITSYTWFPNFSDTITWIAWQVSATHENGDTIAVSDFSFFSIDRSTDILEIRETLDTLENVDTLERHEELVTLNTQETPNTLDTLTHIIRPGDYLKTYQDSLIAACLFEYGIIPSYLSMQEMHRLNPELGKLSTINNCDQLQYPELPPIDTLEWEKGKANEMNRIENERQQLKQHQQELNELINTLIQNIGQSPDEPISDRVLADTTQALIQMMEQIETNAESMGSHQLEKINSTLESLVEFTGTQLNMIPEDKSNEPEDSIPNPRSSNGEDSPDPESTPKNDTISEVHDTELEQGNEDVSTTASTYWLFVMTSTLVQAMEEFKKALRALSGEKATVFHVYVHTLTTADKTIHGSAVWYCPDSLDTNISSDEIKQTEYVSSPGRTAFMTNGVSYRIWAIFKGDEIGKEVAVDPYTLPMPNKTKKNQSNIKHFMLKVRNPSTGNRSK